MQFWHKFYSFTKTSVVLECLAENKQDYVLIVALDKATLPMHCYFLPVLSTVLR